MSPRLAISAVISVLMMAGYLLSATGRAPEPFGSDGAPAEVRAEAPTPVHSSLGSAIDVFR
jgi:hypothetical protein